MYYTIKCPTSPYQPKDLILFHVNMSPRDLYKMTLGGALYLVFPVIVIVLFGMFIL